MNVPFATCIILLLIKFSLSASDQFLLRSNWEVGKAYTQTSTVDTSFQNPALGEAGIQKSMATQTLSVMVTQDSEPDRKVAEVKILSLQGSIDLMGQTLSYNSAEPEKSPPFLQQAFGSLAGKMFSLVYDQDNNYVETRLVEGHAPATPLGTGKGLSGQQLSDAFRKSQELPLPKAPVSIGDTWRYKDQLEMPPIGVIGIEASGKFDSIVEENGHRQAKLLIEGTFQLPQGESAVIPFDSGSKFTSEIFFDLDRQVVARSSTNSIIHVLIDGKKTPLSQKVETKLTSVKNAR